MPGLDRLPELLLICLVGLLVLGPRRMIQMGSALGKALRELREATKDMNWGTMLGSEASKETSATLGALSQFTQSLTSSVKEIASPTAASTSGRPTAGRPTAAAGDHTTPTTVVESRPITDEQPEDREATQATETDM